MTNQKLQDRNGTDLVIGAHSRDNLLMRRVISLGALLFALLGLSLVVAGPAHAARFFLRPNSGPVGSTFTIVGAGFLPSEAVRFTWDGRPLAVEEANVNGDVETTATVPQDAILGGHEVRAEGTSSGLGYSQVFTVTKTEAAAPAPAPAPPQSPGQASAPVAAQAAAPAATAPAAPATPSAPAEDLNAIDKSAFTPITLIPVPPDSAAAEVAFDVKVPLPGASGLQEPPEALLLIAFGMLSVIGVRTLSLGRRLHIW